MFAQLTDDLLDLVATELGDSDLYASADDGGGCCCVACCSCCCISGH